MNPILAYIAFVSFWGGVVRLMLNYKEPRQAALGTRCRR